MELTIPTRTNDSSGSRIVNGPLHIHALRSILLEPPRWYDAFSAAISNVDDNVRVFSFGPERSVPASLIWKARTKVIHLGDFSDGARSSKADRRSERPVMDSDIAVVGMACKVPGADNVEEFWDLLLSGQSQHREIGGPASDSSRFNFEDTPYRTTEDANMRRKWFANLIDNYDQFDHRFFKKSARESATMDPQQRHVLQVAYQAVEQSGYLQTAEAEREAEVGCFLGVCMRDYENNVACHPANAFTATGNLQGFIAGKVSHFFGWTGPGLVIDTACSSSLVAVHQACRAILSGECNAALAGGTHIMNSATWFQNLAAGSFLSPTGQCKPFDAAGDGYCRGEGVGTVFLKKMSQAVADGDQILGVIAATAVQQNQNCTPIFVPNVPGLADLFTNVTAKARVKPSQISVVEAHGTGTAVGDPAEYQSIRKVLGGGNRASEDPLMISSVKGLVGHMECTSGIISLIKVLLMLNKGIIPPQASFKTLSPALEAGPADQMCVPTRAQQWDVSNRIALINNYGASGSNASLVISQAPCKSVDKIRETADHSAAIRHPFWISCLDDRSLRRRVKAFRKFLDRSAGDASLANISFDLARQRNSALDWNLICTAGSVEELKRSMAILDDSNASTPSNIQIMASPPVKPTTILCFGGQISTYIGLDRQLYSEIALLRKHLDNVDSVVQSLGSQSIYPGVFQRTPILDIVHLQTILFATQYAFARCWIDSGIQPAALVGHSFGELTALCISHILSLEDTVKMIVSRATLIQDAWGIDKGAMLAIESSRTDAEKLLMTANQKHIDTPASIACYNGPRSFTLAGSTKSIDQVAIEAENVSDRSIRSKRLKVTNAFHSALVDPLLIRLEQSAQSLTFRDPVIPLERATEESTNTKLNARFVADHMRNPVYFHHAVERLARKHSSSPTVFLEAGTNSTITSMAARAIAGLDLQATNVFQGVNIADCNDGYNKLTDITVSLAKAGVPVQHWAHHKLQMGSQPDMKPLFLPPYQFDPDSRHWLELKAVPKYLKELPSTEEARKLANVDETSQGLLTFFGFQDGPTNKLARFRINTMTDEYKQLLSGHCIAQTAPICPATVQISFVINAIGEICPTYHRTREPQIQEVEYQSPVCANSARTTWIEADMKNEESAIWQFTVYSTDTKNGETKSQTRMSHTTGKIIFSNLEDLSLKREMVRFERLFGHCRAVELLQSPEVDEMLTNRNIYRIFSEIVDYGEEFRGVQKLVSRGNETAGLVVRLKSHPKQSENGFDFDPHLADTFCQLGGIWINCMTDRSQSDLFLANSIDQWIRAPGRTGGKASAAQKPSQYHVFATHHKQSDRLSLTDVFVFDAINGALVEVILGIAYVKVPKLSMERLLTRLTEPTWLTKSSSSPGNAPSPPVEDSLSASKADTPAPISQQLQAHLEVSSAPVEASSAPKPRGTNEKSVQNDLMLQVKGVMAELLGLEVAEIKDDSLLADLGIDSLTGMEMIHEIETSLKVTLDESEMLHITDVPGLMKAVFAATGQTIDANVANSNDFDSRTPQTTSSDSLRTSSQTTPVTGSDIDKEEDMSACNELRLPFGTVMEAFNETKQLTDTCVATFEQSHYVAESLPRQNELAITLTLEAFEALGAGFSDAQPGQRLTRIPHGGEHVHLVNHLYHMLETETQIIKVDEEVITRTAVPLPLRPSNKIYEDLLALFPDQHPADQLTYYAGVNLARVLSGEIDGVKLIFGSTTGRDLVSAFYAEWPLNRVLYAQMEDFLTRLTEKLQTSGDINDSKPLRILEMGAGTGGTTRRLLPLFARLQVPVEYTFTDIAPSFVAAARKQWAKQYPFMKFRAHDIENSPEQDLVGTQHIILASNAIHATHSLCESTRNVRKALRPDGILLMLEMTRTPYWVDLIFGLFEGWWMFDDGRRHALTHETRWKKDLQAVGYGHVDWTDGDRPESDIEKLILAAASSTSR